MQREHLVSVFPQIFPLLIVFALYTVRTNRNINTMHTSFLYKIHYIYWADVLNRAR